MFPTPELEAIENWLIREALGEPEIATMFAGMCERMRSAAIPLDRAMLSWTTLHPLIEAETALWLPGEAPITDHHTHDAQQTEDWLKSPVRALLEARDKQLRRKLENANGTREFPILERLRQEGFTDYLIVATHFDLPSVNPFDVSGILVAWSTRAPDGFTDEAIEHIDYLQMRLALACRGSIQARIARTLAETYLGRRAGDQVLSGRIRHGDGAAIDAVIFFSDLRGSTALADRLDPAEYLTHLNAYFEAAAGAVLAQDGEVLDFIGDAVLAIFPIGDDGLAPAARKAYRAACDVGQRIAHVQSRTPHRLACGVALSAGEVMFGNIGVADRLTFSVIGRTVNAAARVEAMTKQLSTPVLVTSDIAAALPEAPFRAMGRYTLDGFDAPVDLYAPET